MTKGALLGGVERARAATPLELFFDLCFVVAISRVASVLHSDPTWKGAAIALGLFIPIWWAWMAYTWRATAYDRDDPVERIATLAGMLGILALAVGVTDAADGHGELFALASAGLRIPLLVLWVRAWLNASASEKPFSFRYILGTSWAIVLWGVSAFVEPDLQYLLWALAVAGEILAPYAAVKAIGRPAYHPEHIVERYGLFTIIVLGESILAVVIGTAQVDLDLEAAVTATFAFMAAGSFWWIYFERVGPGGLGRSRRSGFIWGYGHLLVWSGIAAFGVGTQIAIEKAGGGVASALAAGGGSSEAANLSLVVMPAGMALAMFALALIGLFSSNARSAVSARLIAGLVLVAISIIANETSPSATAAAIAAAMVILATLELRASADSGTGGSGQVDSV
jgi:low temperature requirement protein LtrA